MRIEFCAPLIVKNAFSWVKNVGHTLVISNEYYIIGDDGIGDEK